MAVLARSRTDATTPPLSPVDSVTVETYDGTQLAARYFAPLGPARGAALIVPAMGVPQSFYGAFARWLASRGFHAVTFDYRGMGLSRTGSLRGMRTDIVTWAELDTAAVLRVLERRAPGVPVTWIGHSLGGQIIPFVRDRGRVEKIVTIATGSGYWRENARPLRHKVWLLWWLAAPVATALVGYFPGRALRMVGDLPAGVIRQWRRWCLDPEYAVGAEGPEVRALFARVTTPITSLSFTDDEMMSAANIESIHGMYVGAHRVLRRIAPGDVGLARIGHFGFFRAEHEPLWSRVVEHELAVAPHAVAS
ncbi:MAG TPA: alpha/beta fold hydrolase [Kofleriaceae bacterium]|nr:alpha/beta fold hydrolase [Kofleriaceae bacterium]